MILVFENSEPVSDLKFSSFSSWYLIQIDGIKENIRITIDNQIYETKFPTTYILLFLKGKDHITKSDRKLTKIKIFTLNIDYFLFISTKLQAADNDRKPWVKLILVQTPLSVLTTSVSYSRRKRDSDDVKIIINGKVQGNVLKNIKHFLWRYAGSLLPKFATKTATEAFSLDLSKNNHIIELWSDRTPVLHSLEVNFGDKLSMPMIIPTRDNPKWTGDFYDDSNEIILARLILGEAENQSKETKVGVGFTVVNRVKKQLNHWGLNLHDVILKTGQYDGIWNTNTQAKVRDPLSNSSSIRREAWFESFDCAQLILSGQTLDPTKKSTSFHSYADLKDFPNWATETNFKIKIGDIYFYELDR